ncbi:uncharacterized protein LOC106651216 isoform X3 [Trichogramma pretiosum]|uniref:uncharacterized protein LOC106651216 isoform X3 n=1 Tax=Trichogramma pretiosum TaxID=7493 RepID=UPI000C71B1D7|nr:uncharacterized protein LOC106651216 isoform X3 [Trichogramma pretiosum]
MSDVTTASSSTTSQQDWFEELQRKIFEECIDQSNEASPTDSDDPAESCRGQRIRQDTALSSVGRTADVAAVPLSVIVRNIHQNFAKVPHFRFIFLSKSQRNDFLEELRCSLERVARSQQVSWPDFRDTSSGWFRKLLNLVQEDGNNNSQSDSMAEDLGKNDHGFEDQSNDDGRFDDDDFQLSSMRKINTMASCHSLNSSSAGFGTDSMLESSEENNPLHDDISGIDLEIRIRRYNEETASLKEDLLRAEETITTLERELKLTQKALDQMNNKYLKLQKENEDHKEMLSVVERREESSKLDARKFEKAYNALQKKVKELERDKECIYNLKVKIDSIQKENSNYIKQISEYKKKYEEKLIECEYLQEEYHELQNNKAQLEKSYEVNYNHQQEKINELQLLNAELQTKMMNRHCDSSSNISMSPPLYNEANLQNHSTPCNKHHKSHQDSLFMELKASGFSYDDSKIQELREELSFYNNEIADIVEKVDEALQTRTNLNTSSTQAVSIQTLKHKITSLLNLVKTSTTIKSPSALRSGESKLEKPDVLPETKKTPVNRSDKNDDVVLENRSFYKNSTVGSAAAFTSTVPSIFENGVLMIDKATSPLLFSSKAAPATDLESSHEQEIVVPIVEALNRIIEIKGTEDVISDQDSLRLSKRSPKPKSIFTAKTNTDWSLYLLRNEASPKSSCITPEYLNFRALNQARGDAAYCDPFDKSPKKKLTSTAMKTLKSESRACKDDAGPDDDPVNVDLRFVTVRPRQSTYQTDSLMTAADPNCSFETISHDEIKPDPSFCTTPIMSKIAPRRKLSVYDRSFEVNSSNSTLQVQESNLKATPLTREQLLHEYRCSNSSDSSLSPSPLPIKDKVIKTNAALDESLKTTTKPIKSVILAPPKFYLPDSSQIRQPDKTSVSKKLAFDKIPEKSEEPHVNFFTSPNDAVVLKNDELNTDDLQQSRILSSSNNDAVYAEEKCQNKDKQRVAVEMADISCSSKDGSFKPATISQIDISANSHEFSGNFFLPSSTEVYNQPCSKIGASPPTIGTTSSPSSDRSVPSNAMESNGVHNSSSSSDNSGKIVDQVGGDECEVSVDVDPERTCGAGIALDCCSSTLSAFDEQKLPPPSVGRAMSSGEDSSAESEECHAADAPLDHQSPVQVPSLLEKSVNETRPMEETMPVDTLQAIIVNNEESSTSELGDVTKNDDDSPKAFPSWTDQRLRDSGIASFPDMDSETSENLSEEDMKKKYTIFSVGLGTDRMTLSKRIILSRRHRDQAEKNFTNEVLKMQQDIKELAPLCVDSESLERVERVKQQLEMIAHCTHQVSCNAETLGAVYQERRVSRAVLLADKYLQTLKCKCEKLAGELAETKKILAENNIVLEENFGEMSDDMPRVRYRTLSNNNRTMMARRRASIATISRPILGSSQDISKATRLLPSYLSSLDLPRQRNSMIGRAPGLRRPSLCSENLKWENEKLDRTDASSINELREIYEQAESRRQSREENNNSIRTSILNLPTVSNEQADEDEILSNIRNDLDLNKADKVEDLNQLETTQPYRYRGLSRLLSYYSNWKPMIWGILIAFLVGFFFNRVVSSTKTSGPPIWWWSIEEILNQYGQVHPI